MAAAVEVATNAAGHEKSANEREAAAMASPEIVHSSYVPAQLNRQLEFLDFNAEGHLLLGCSDLTGRNWTGSLWYYRDPNEAPQVERALTGVDCDNGVVDGRFVGDGGRQLLVALDGGGVEYISLVFNDALHGDDAGTARPVTTSGAAAPSPDFFYFERLHWVQEHDDIITGLDVTADGTKAVTCSYDRSMVTLDVSTLRLESRIQDAHLELIANLAANRKNPNLVATAANDGTVVTWDLRSGAHLSRPYQDADKWPTCVEWTPESEFHLLVGNQNGEVLLFDTRNPKISAAKLHAIDKQIHAMRFSPNRPHLVVVAGDTYLFKALSVDDSYTDLTVKFENKSHDDFVRGLAWHPQSDVLYTCSFDRKVMSHKID